MSSLDSLPPEILCQISTHLPAHEFKNALLVCRALYRTFKPTLYQKILWPCEVEYAPDEYSARKWAVAFDGPAVWNGLETNGMHVHNLSLTCECEEHHVSYYFMSSASCPRMNTSLFYLPDKSPRANPRLRFPNLKTLELKLGYHDMLAKMPILPHLHGVWLSSTSDFDQTHGRASNLKCLRRLFDQPHLSCLDLASVDISTGTRLCGPMSARRLTKLVLRSSFIPLSTLVAMLRGSKTLQSLQLGLTNPFSGSSELHPERKAMEETVSDTYALALKQVEHSVENLQLYHNGYSGVYQKWTHTETLVNFQQLKRLTVNPSLFTRRQLCQRSLNGQIGPRKVLGSRPLSSFNEILPQSVEQLTLLLDYDEVDKTEGFRTDLIQGIVRDRVRLAKLQVICFVELDTFWTQLCFRCSKPDDFERCCFRHYEGKSTTSPMNNEEAADFQRMVNACQDIGILLELVDTHDKLNSRKGSPGFSFLFDSDEQENF